MSGWSAFRHPGSCQIIGVLLAGVLAIPALAHETQEKVEDPGFRPESEHASAFVESFDTATIVVYPSIIRKVDRIAYSYTSREQIFTSLNEGGKTSAIIANSRIDMGALQGQSQWEWFQNGIAGGIQGGAEKGARCRLQPGDGDTFPTRQPVRFRRACFHP